MANNEPAAGAVAAASGSRIRHVLKTTAWAIFIIGFIVTTLLTMMHMAGGFLSSFRMYLTGVATASVITKCEQVMEVDPGGTFVTLEYRVKTRGRPESLPIAYCSEKGSVGQPVKVLYSKAASRGIAIRGEPTLWQVIRNEHSGMAIGVFALTAIAAAFFTLYRVVRIAVVAWRATAEAVGRTRKVQGGFVAKALGWSETGTDFVFLVLLFMTVAVMLYSLMRALLYMNNASELGFGSLALATLILVWSPAPTKMIELSWRAYKTNLMALVRNVVAIGLMAKVNNLAVFLKDADLRELQDAAAGFDCRGEGGGGTLRAGRPELARYSVAVSTRVAWKLLDRDEADRTALRHFRIDKPLD